jgi:hypothetical protein
MLVKQANGETGYSAVFEDDGKVAYAYLLSEDRIVADVWLYNRIAAPQEPEWRDRSKAPFANPQGFAASEPFPPVLDETEITFAWSRGATGHGNCESLFVASVMPRSFREANQDGASWRSKVARSQRF